MLTTFIVGALFALLISVFVLLLVERSRLKSEISGLESLLNDALGDLRMAKASSIGLETEVNALNRELSYAHKNIEMILEPKTRLGSNRPLSKV